MRNGRRAPPSSQHQAPQWQSKTIHKSNGFAWTHWRAVMLQPQLFLLLLVSAFTTSTWSQQLLPFASAATSYGYGSARKRTLAAAIFGRDGGKKQQQEPQQQNGRPHPPPLASSWQQSENPQIPPTLSQQWDDASGSPPGLADRAPPPPPLPKGPPPPPPPLPKSSSEGQTTTTNASQPVDSLGGGEVPPPPLDQSSDFAQQEYLSLPPQGYFPPSPYDNTIFQPQYQQSVEQSGAWPPPPVHRWMEKQQVNPQDPMGGPQQHYQYEQDPMVWHYETMVQDLHLQMQNLTSVTVASQQQQAMQLQKLDALTEELAACQAEAARTHNVLMEVEANGTALAEELVQVRYDVAVWEERCTNLTQTLEETETAYKSQLRQARREAESLATLIERHRLDEERVVEERQKTQKKRGFLAWLFGWSSLAEESEEDWDDLRDKARATLLGALQTERDNVEELELALTVLQQNNSAIAEQVQSRDEVIEELNDRISVFEEDKLVLKAALRQLQKEMRDEEPKTQQLITELEATKADLEELQEKMDLLGVQYEQNLADLESTLTEKEAALQGAESNLTVIGTYVDRLEERLADFAILRRELDVRGQKCAAVEQRAEEAEQQRLTLQKRIKELETEHQELKSLLEELVQDRNRHEKEKAILVQSQKELDVRDQRANQSMQQLNGKIEELEQARRDLNEQIEGYESDIQKLHGENARLAELLRASEGVAADLRTKVDEMILNQQEAEAMMLKVETTREDLADKLEAAMVAQRTAENKVNELSDAPQPKAEEIAKLTQKVASLESIRTELQTQLNAANAAQKAAEDKVQSLMKKQSPPGPQRQRPPPPPPADVMSGSRTQPSGKPLSRLLGRRGAPVARFNQTITGNVTRVRPPPWRAPDGTWGFRPPTRKQQTVPFRDLRKKFSKTTGIHGLFSGKSRKRRGASQPLNPKLAGKGPQQLASRPPSLSGAIPNKQENPIPKPPPFGKPPRPLPPGTPPPKKSRQGDRKQEAPNTINGDKKGVARDSDAAPLADDTKDDTPNSKSEAHLPPSPPPPPSTSTATS